MASESIPAKFGRQPNQPLKGDWKIFVLIWAGEESCQNEMIPHV